MRLSGKVAIVTGASRGIGRGIALRFAHEGARVAVVHAQGDSGQQVVDQIRAAGGQAIVVHCDTSDGRQVKAMVQRVMQEWGTIDILVNDAGICPFHEFLDMPEELWERVLDVNLKGYFLVSQAVAKVMVAQGVKGRIIAIGSISGEFGGSLQAHYCASKGGINLLVKSMAISLGRHGITCNAVLPGTVETDANRDALSNAGTRRYWEQRAPLGRLGTPEDVAGAALFFASNDSDWCTGSLLVVDGGVSVNLQ